MSDPTPPDEGGIFLTHENQFPSTLPEGIISDKDDVPDGYEDAWGNLKEKIEGELYDKYKSQLTRYHEAYHTATNRIPKINIYVILYIATGTYYHDEEYHGLRKDTPEGFSLDP